MMISIQFRSGGGSAIASGDDGNSTGQTVPLCTHFGTCTAAGRFDDLYFFPTLSLLLLWLECRWGTECCLGTEERTSVHFASAAYVWLSFAFFFACWLCMFTLCFFSYFFNLHPHECQWHFLLCFSLFSEWKVGPRHNDLAHFYGSSIECRWQLSVWMCVSVCARLRVLQMMR